MTLEGHALDDDFGVICIKVMVGIVPKDEIHKTEQLWIVNILHYLFILIFKKCLCPLELSVLVNGITLTQGRHLGAHICSSHLHLSSWYLYFVGCTLFIICLNFLFSMTLLLLYLKQALMSQSALWLEPFLIPSFFCCTNLIILSYVNSF